MLPTTGPQYLKLDFVIKHVRPLAQSGFNALCTPELFRALDRIGMDMDDAMNLRSVWLSTALQDPALNPAVFEQHALLTSTTRLTELGKLTQSSIAFLTGPQLQDLDQAALRAGPNAAFTWTPVQPPLLIQVNLTAKPPTAQILPGVRGLQLSTDENGQVVHYGGWV